MAASSNKSGQSNGVRRRAIIAVSVLLAGTAALGGWWYYRKSTIRETFVSLRTEGLAAREAGRNAEAADKLWGYLQRDPSDKKVLEAFIRARMAAPLPRAQHITDSIRAYQRLIALAPERNDLRMELGELYLRMRSQTEALDVANAILEKEPKNQTAMRVKTQALEGLRRPGDAMAAAEAWTKAYPNDLDAYTTQFRIMISQTNQAGDALRMVNELAAQRPDDQEVALVRGSVLLGAGQNREADAVFRKLAASELNDDLLAERLAGQLDGLGAGDLAAKVLSDRLAKSGSQKLRLLMARRSLESKGFDASLKVLEGVAEKDVTGEIRLIRALAGVAKANSVGEVNTGDATWDAVGRIMLGRLPTTDAERVDQSKAIRDLISTGEAGPYPWYALGMIASQQGENEQAIEYFVRSSELTRSWALPLVLATDLALKADKREQAKRYAAMAVMRRPTELEPYLIMARVMYSEYQRNPQTPTEDLLSLVEAIQQTIPGEASTLTMEIDLLARKGRKDDARKQALKAIAPESKATEETLLACAILSQEHGLGVEQQCLARSEAAYGRSPRWRYMTAMALGQAGKVQEGLKIIEEGQNDPKASDMTRLVLREVAARYGERMRLPNTAALWKAAVEGNSTGVQLLRAAAKSDFVLLDPAVHAMVVEKLKAAEGNTGTAWRVARARGILINPEGGNRAAQEAAVILGDVIASGSPSADVHGMMAMALQRLGNTAGAVTQLESALRLDPNSSRQRLLLAALLQDRRDLEGARKQVEAAVAADPSDEVKAAAARLLSSQGDVRRAIALIEGLPQRDRAGDQMLGELYERVGNADEAAAVAKRLMAEPDVRSALLAARIAERAGRTEDAMAALAKVDQLSNSPVQRKLLRAQYHASLGDFGQAMKLVEEALADAPQEPGGYRYKALLQLSTNEFDEAVKTAELAEKKGAKDPVLAALVKDRVALKVLFERKLLPLALEKLARPDDERFKQTTDAVMAIDGLRVTASAGAVKSAANASPGVFAVQHAAIRTLLTLGRTNEASSMASSLARALPNSIEAATLWAEVESARGPSDLYLEALEWATSRPVPVNEVVYVELVREQRRRDRASEAVKRAADMAEKPGAMRLGWMVEYGLAAHATGRGAEFDRKFDTWAKTEPALAPSWAIAVSDQLTAKSVRPWLERIEKQKLISPIGLAMTTEAAGTRIGDNDLRAAAGVQYDALLEVEEKLGVIDRLNLATKLEGRQNETAAARIYRSLLADKFIGAAAKNNLAMLLARQGKTDEAIKLAQDVVAGDPLQTAYLDTLAEVYERSGKTTEAISTIEKAVQLNPAAVVWRMRLARLLLKADKREDAKVQLDEITTQVSDRPTVLNSFDKELQELRGQLAKLSG